MLPASPPEIMPPVSQDSWRVDRARILREATIEFLGRTRTNDWNIDRFEALATGLLPRLTRDEAIEIARMLADCETISSAIHDAFAAHGIRLRRLLTQRHEAVSSVADKDGVTQMQSNSSRLRTPDDQQRFVAATSWHIVGLDPVLALALARAADRNDHQDFSDIVQPALAQLGIVLDDEAMQRIFADSTGELAAMIVAALGGDATLVARTLTGLFGMASNRLKLQNVLHTFGNLSPDLASQVLRDYFVVPKPVHMQRGVHTPLQSGQAKRGRENYAQATSTRLMLSARMTKAYRDQR
ncbi:MAG: hypothetical protein ACRCXM_03170 [Beijerinckiaceae bacterium]